LAIPVLAFFSSLPFWASTFFGSWVLGVGVLVLEPLVLGVWVLEP
jgi:hypothetical protein